jgi:hypothetical protein
MGDASTVIAVLAINLPKTIRYGDLITLSIFRDWLQVLPQLVSEEYGFFLFFRATVVVYQKQQ